MGEVGKGSSEVLCCGDCRGHGRAASSGRDLQVGGLVLGSWQEGRATDFAVAGMIGILNPRTS